jgi:hypothetical protein
LVTTFLGYVLYKDPKYFSWVSKDAELYVDFKNINLP